MSFVLDLLALNRIRRHRGTTSANTSCATPTDQQRVPGDSGVDFKNDFFAGQIREPTMNDYSVEERFAIAVGQSMTSRQRTVVFTLAGGGQLLTGQRHGSSVAIQEAYQWYWCSGSRLFSFRTRARELVKSTRLGSSLGQLIRFSYRRSKTPSSQMLSFHQHPIAMVSLYQVTWQLSSMETNKLLGSGMMI